MPIETRRVLPQNHAEVRSQLNDIERRIDQGGLIRQGASGPVVEDLQRRLRSFGLYQGPIDGDFGPQTTAAVRAFQQREGLIADGTVGNQTLGAMRAKTAFVQDGFETAAGRGQRGADVRNAERVLRDLGMGPGPVDGVFDAKTAQAVQRFRANDPTLSPGARIDARTFARMREQASQPLEQGDSGPAVRRLEANLKKLGRDPGAVGGAYTADTARAVRNFQRDNGLPATGIADPATRAKIQEKVDALAPSLADVLKTPPKHDYRRVSVDGETVNVRTKEMLDRATRIMKERFGHANFDFGIVQGSYSSGVSASAGTHDGGGALDIHTRTLPRGTVDDAVKALRMAGFAAWSRGRGHDSFDPHIHAIAIGDRELASGAANQVQEYFNGGDGLVGSALDPDRGLGRNGLIPPWARAFER